jgi:hypothetical protein
MPVITLGWRYPFEGEDLHLIRGTGAYDVGAMLRFTDRQFQYDLADAFDHGLTDIEFKPRLRITSDTGGNFVAPGVEVHAATGSIDPDPSPPEPRLEHFYLDIKATIAGKPKPDIVSLLVWLHDGIDDAWGTPSPITIPRRRGAAVSWRSPTLLARFDDGVIGDVTNHPGVTILGATNAAVTFGTTATPGATIPFTATLPPALLDTQVTFDAVVAPAWEELPEDERMVECLGGSALAADADEATANILVLVEGVPDRDEGLVLARALASRMHRMRPFSWAADKILYWGMWLPSRQSGGTLRWMADTADGWPLPVTRPEPPPATGAWGLDHLIHVAGPSAPEPAGGWPPLADQLNTWSVHLPYTVAQLTARVSEATYQQWQAEARVPLNQRDTALGVIQGWRTATYAKPGAREAGRYRDLHFGRASVSRAELDRLLGALVDRNGDSMGDRWTQGRDRRLVVVLSGGHADVGNFLFEEQLVVMGIERSGETPLVTSRSDDRGSDVTGARWPVGTAHAAATHLLVGRFAHEIGHALGLGDEYGGEHELPAESVPFCTLYANLQSEDGDRGLSDGTRLQGDRIRWNHLRIARAFTLRKDNPILEVLDESVDPVREVDGRIAYRIQVEAGQLDAALADGFDLNDGSHTTLFLRTRDLTGDILDTWNLSSPVELIRSEPFFDLVWVREKEAGAFDPFRRIVEGRLGSATYPPILFAPVPKAIEPEGWATLVPKLVRDHLTASGRPLDAPSRSEQAAWTCPAMGNDSGWPRMRNRPPIRKGEPFFPARRVPAAWTGGMVYDCGLFHPTSHSIMRGDSSRNIYSPTDGDTFIPPGDVDLPKPLEANEFDPVASYLLIDKLDPSRHHELERLMALRDPD